MINYKILLLLVVICFLNFPIIVKANIMCEDGTNSPTCEDCHQGCCSYHGGCATSDSNYSGNKVEDDDNNSLLMLTGLAIGSAGIAFGYYKGKKDKL